MTEPYKLVFVVDDSPTNLQILLELLEQQGWYVAIAQSGEEAINKLEKLKPDLILLDVIMPGINGFETCRRLKASEITANIPIIFMTALDNPADRIKGLKLGAIDYITKPFQQEEVLTRLDTHWQLQHLRTTLEQQVAERTAALTDTLEHLKTSQLQLIQSEKMAALGELVAGVAHEIKNPVTFISGNLKHADSYANGVLGLLDLYQQDFPEATPRIQAEMEALDLDFVRTDFPKLLASLKLGTDRLQAMVRSLRVFSRAHETERVAANIHDGLDSTLTILQSRLRAQPDRVEIQVQKDYADLPMVTCYVSELNQVFMNLLANAIDALEEAIPIWEQQDLESLGPDGSALVPVIQIRTAMLDSDRVRIAIADNGPGIPGHLEKLNISRNRVSCETPTASKQALHGHNHRISTVKDGKTPMKSPCWSPNTLPKS
jgi:two-component system NtrC family sensor kinase